MLTPALIRKVAIALATSVILPILAAYYIGIGAAWVTLAVCIVLIVVFSDRVRVRTVGWSHSLQQKGANHKMSYFFLISSAGALFGFILFGVAWLVAFRIVPIPAPTVPGGNTGLVKNLQHHDKEIVEEPPRDSSAVASAKIHRAIPLISSPPKAPIINLDINGSTAIGDYPTGYNMYGIHWWPVFTDVRVNITNPTVADYFDVDLMITVPDGFAILEYAQVTSIPSVYFINQDQILQKEPIINIPTNNGQELHVPETAPIGNESVRMRCDKLPQKTTLKLILAVQHVGTVPEWNAGQKPWRTKITPLSFTAKGEYKVEDHKRIVDVTHAFTIQQQ
jgi:hypothetical protein